ncbi:homeodomain-like protein [Rhizophagus clarus]|uniref:Homeodomain-like protein n=1 Tax=Rhizophagus clarus TaxID=94130 RepID=A0A8H3R063_9GLOM|nr:homeodomain-like protein [Rhizophagus clarus]
MRKLQKAAKTSSELLRNDFMYKIGSEFRPKRFVFIDETSKDVRSLSRAYEYALALDGFITADIMEGSYNKKRYQTFILTQVLPQINEYQNKTLSQVTPDMKDGSVSSEVNDACDDRYEDKCDCGYSGGYGAHPE